MDKFDGVFDGQDMAFESFVEIVDHARKRGRFTGTRRTGNEDQSFLLLSELLENWRHAELFESENFCRNRPEDRRLSLALHKNVDTETGVFSQGERKIAFQSFLKDFALRVTHDIEDERVNLFGS